MEGTSKKQRAVSENSSTTPTDSHLSSDQPIAERSEDRLKRGVLIDLLAQEILAAPTADGFVMAITAPWGDGKTSVLNLVADSVDDQVAIVRFNPWLFSDAQSLVLRFFGEVSAQLRRDQRLRRVGRKLASYGQAIAPIGSIALGPVAGAVGQSTAALAAAQGKTVFDELAEIKSLLRQQEKRVLVLIDDIDRLHREEIRDVMRLVKLVGDLPFVTYLLAFDRTYVEDALDGGGAEGRSYLEKVVQVTYDLPAIRRSDLEEVLFDRVNAALEPLEHLPLYEERWSELYSRGMRHFFRNLRDVARYVSGLSTQIRLIGNEVALEDILALEALRVFEPGVYRRLPSVVEALTKSHTELVFNQETRDKEDEEEIKEVLKEVSDPRRAQVETLLATLFPPAAGVLGGSKLVGGPWRGKRQVADAAAFRAYLHATLDPGSASYALIQEVLAAFGNKDALRGKFNNSASETLLDLIERLPDFKTSFPSEGGGVAAAELLRLETKLPETDRPFRPAPQSHLHRAIHFALSAIPDEGEREAALLQIYEQATCESERLSLLHWFGAFPQRERRRADEELLSEENTASLVSDLGNRVRSTEPAKLAQEPQLYALVLESFNNEEALSLLRERATDDDLMLALLRACVRRSEIYGGPLVKEERSFELSALDRVLDRAFVVGRLPELRLIEDLGFEDREALDLAEEALVSEETGDNVDETSDD